jgi:hypothetical protein
MLSHTKIIYVLIAVLFVALGFMFYQNQKIQTVARTSGTSPSQNPVVPTYDASTTAALASITVGSPPTATNNINNVMGTITLLGSNSMQIKDQMTGSTDTVSITSGTQVQLAGALKDAATFQKELAAYNVQVQMLMKDPIKNKMALAAMQVPINQEVSPGTLADLAVGNSVMVVTSNITSGNVYVASSIYKSTATALTQ